MSELEYKRSKTFQDLSVWQKAHALVLEVYKYSNKFPKEEVYALTPQFRRAAVSVPANIAESFRKDGLKDTLRFLNIAQGSLEECRYYIILTKDLGYGDNPLLEDLIVVVSKMLTAYSKSIAKHL